MFKNRVLRRIFGPKRDEVKREWSKLYNEERNDLYSSPNIVQVIKSRKVRLAGHVAYMGEGRGMYSVLVGKAEGKNDWRDTGIDGRIILRWIFRRWDVGGIDWIELAQDRDGWWALGNVFMNLQVP